MDNQCVKILSGIIVLRDVINILGVQVHIFVIGLIIPPNCFIKNNNYYYNTTTQTESEWGRAHDCCAFLWACSTRCISSRFFLARLWVPSYREGERGEG